MYDPGDGECRDVFTQSRDKGIYGDKKQGLLLADGVYPKLPLLVHSAANHTSEQELFYASKHKGRRKAIEQAFGVF